MTLPNFLIVGAARSGTSSLHRYLNQHPQVFTSRLKELNYFVSKPRMTLGQYEAHFEDADGALAIGESSVAYLYFETVAQEIKQLLGDIRIIICLRQPVDRAYSHYQYRRSRFQEPIDEFLTAFHAESQLIRERNNPFLWSYKSAGFYSRQITPYYQHFSAENIHVILFDDFVADPSQTVKGVYDFLGVDPDFEPDVITKHAPSRLPSFSKDLWILRSRSLIQYIRGQAAHPPPLTNRPIPPLPASVRTELTKLYWDDMLATEGLIGRDLSLWRVND